MARLSGDIDQELDEWLEELLHCPKGCQCLSHWPQRHQSLLSRYSGQSPVAEVPVTGFLPTATLAVELEPASLTIPDHDHLATASVDQTLDLLLACGAGAQALSCYRAPAAPPASSSEPQLALKQALNPCSQPCVSRLCAEDPCAAVKPSCVMQALKPVPVHVARRAVPGAARTEQWHPDITDATHPKLQNAGKALEHCENLVSSVIEGGLTVFKIGVACDPNHRWLNKDFGYMWDADFKHMLLMHQDETRACGFLESALIGKFGQISGCRNVAPGGEGIRKFQPDNLKLASGSPAVSYVYIVFKHLPKRPPARPMAAKSRPLPYKKH